MAEEFSKRRQRSNDVRQVLLQKVIDIAADKGFTAVTIQTVATAAKLTKGGLFHYFPNKRTLIDAAFKMLLDEMEHEITMLMENDHEPYGRFTRAYLDQALNARNKVISTALWNSAIADKHLNKARRNWFIKQIEQAGGNEMQTELEAVRFAVDGLWLGTLTDISPTSPDAFRNYLRSMTFPKGS
ncbi:TetR/AcrR family transcriptional regulator [Brucellaceae bacterium C25G]